MKRSNSLALAFASLALTFAAGCSSSSMGSVASPKSAERPHARGTTAAHADDAEGATDAELEAADFPKREAAPRKAREVGDFVVFRFSGSYREAPVVMTERVIAKNETTVTLEVSLAEEKEDGSADALRVYRVTVDTTPAKSGSIETVTRLVKGKERAEKREAYEAFIARTTLAADQNEGAIATEKTEIEVSGVKIACERSSFRVRIGKRQATLSTLVSDAFAWNDVGGEMKADDGSVLYKAELVRVGTQESKSSVAKADPGKSDERPAEIASVYED